VRYTIRVFRGPFARWMRRRGWYGVTLPWFGRALVLMWSEPEWNEIRHELAHVEQMAKLGRARWLLTIIGQYVRHGYEEAPLEREARKAAGQE